MKFESGIILFTENYDETLRFYNEGLGLNLKVRNNDLSILDFGGSYLMIEHGGVASNTEKSRSQNPFVLRFNVENFKDTVDELTGRGIQVNVQKMSWGGIIGTIIDPDGNRIELI